MRLRLLRATCAVTVETLERVHAGRIWLKWKRCDGTTTDTTRPVTLDHLSWATLSSIGVSASFTMTVRAEERVETTCIRFERQAGDRTSTLSTRPVSRHHLARSSRC